MLTQWLLLSSLTLECFPKNEVAGKMTPTPRVQAPPDYHRQALSHAAPGHPNPRKGGGLPTERAVVAELPAAEPRESVRPGFWWPTKANSINQKEIS